MLFSFPGKRPSLPRTLQLLLQRRWKALQTELSWQLVSNRFDYNSSSRQPPYIFIISPNISLIYTSLPLNWYVKPDARTGVSPPETLFVHLTSPFALLSCQVGAGIVPTYLIGGWCVLCRCVSVTFKVCQCDFIKENRPFALPPPQIASCQTARNRGTCWNISCSEVFPRGNIRCSEGEISVAQMEGGVRASDILLIFSAIL